MTPLTIALNPLSYPILTFVVIGFITLVNKLYDRDWRDAAVIITAALVGGLGGHFIHDIGGLTGLLIGLNSSGLVTTAIKFGLTSQPTPPVPAQADSSTASPLA